MKTGNLSIKTEDLSTKTEDLSIKTCHNLSTLVCWQAAQKIGQADPCLDHQKGKGCPQPQSNERNYRSALQNHRITVRMLFWWDFDLGSQKREITIVSHWRIYIGSIQTCQESPLVEYRPGEMETCRMKQHDDVIVMT